MSDRTFFYNPLRHILYSSFFIYFMGDIIQAVCLGMQWNVTVFPKIIFSLRMVSSWKAARNLLKYIQFLKLMLGEICVSLIHVTEEKNGQVL